MQTLKLLSSAVLCTCSRRRGRASPNPRARSLPRAVAQPPSYHLPPPPRVPLTIHLVTQARIRLPVLLFFSTSPTRPPLRVKRGHLRWAMASLSKACRARLLAYILGDDGEQQKQQQEEKAGEARSTWTRTGASKGV